MYCKKNKKDLCITAVYVNDLLILTSNKESLCTLKKQLSQNFKMKDFGEARHLLGLIVRITQDQKTGEIALDQSSYIERKLQEYGMEDCNPVSTPFNTNVKLNHDMEPKTQEDQEAR